MPTNPHFPAATATSSLPRRAIALAAAATLALAACGSGDTSTTDSTTTVSNTEAAATTTTGATASSIDPSLADYCAIATELFEQDGLPTTAQLDRYAATAPAAISGPTKVVVEAFANAGTDPSALFSDPDVVTAIGELTAFEAETCGLGQAPDPGANEIDPDATVVELSATDFHFEGQLPTVPGRYSLVMTNDGESPHLMVLIQLAPDADIAEVMAAEGESGVLASFESGIAVPGDTAVISADLTAGRWVLVCPIPTEDGTSHIEHGMIVEFTVT